MSDDGWFRGCAAAAMLLGLTGLGGGCAITMGTVHALSGDWPTSSSHEQRTWVDGQPSRVVTAEVVLATPPRVVCEETIAEPASHVVRDDWGLNGGARFAIGFIGVSELALGVVPILLADEVDLDAAGAVALGALALDGLVTVIMAATIPDTHKRTEYDEPPRRLRMPTCPTEVTFESRGQVVSLASDGTLAPVDARRLIDLVLAGPPELYLRNGPDLRPVAVPPEVLCDWATWLDHPAQRRLCPRAVVPVPVPVVPVRPPPIR